MGVEKTLLKAGTGPKPAVGQTVTVHCTGYGKNGDLSQKFWSTKDPGQQPFKFQVGQGRVIKDLMGLLWLKNVDLRVEKNADLMVLLWLKNADLRDEKRADLTVPLWLKNADLMDEKNADMMPYGCQMHWGQCRGYRELKTEKNQSITRNYRGWLCYVLVKLWWNRDKDSGLLRIPYLQTVLGRVLRRYVAQIPPNRIETAGYRLRTAGYRMDGNKEEGSSLEDRQPIPTAHEIGESSGQAEEALQVVTTVTILMENPRFMEVLKSSSITHQVQGSFDMPRGTFGMAGYQNQEAGTAPICPVVGGPEVFMPHVSVPMLQTPPMDQLMAYDEPKPYKEDVQSVQFDTFSGFHERNKELHLHQHTANQALIEHFNANDDNEDEDEDEDIDLEKNEGGPSPHRDDSEDDDDDDRSGAPGWDEGVLGMQIGEVARLKCSPDYAYGAGGFPAWGIQPNSELVFEIEVIEVA
ncbi:hypothetical protein L7F22_017857 [Adiantum nelumboides]|nr:hypothetical protein [Adiantum nelumboides]